jgi:hypothetical protein
MGLSMAKHLANNPHNDIRQPKSRNGKTLQSPKQKTGPPTTKKTT